jgi:hypothetical protein
MTLEDLIEQLEDYRNELGGDCEVRLMCQPHWPFEHEIAGLASTLEMADLDDRETNETTNGAVIYLTEGRQLGYGSKTAWEIHS